MPKRSAPLTKRDLDGLQRQAAADPTFNAKRADGGQHGLYVRVRQGRVEFWHRTRGPRRSETFIDRYGAITLHQARKAARERRGLEAEGLDVGEVLAKRRRDATTLGEAIDLYLGDLRRRAETGAKRGRQSTLTEFERMLSRSELASLRKKPVKAVRAGQVRRLHRKMADTPAAANRTLTALSAAFSFARAEGLIEANPCEHVQRFEEKGRRRALTRDELERLGDELHRTEATNPRIVLLVRLLALTGVRRSEVVGHVHRVRGGDALRWGDVDLDRGLVTLRDSKTGPQVRVIGQAAADLLQVARSEGAEDDDYVIPGAKEDQPYRAVNTTRRRLWKRAGLPLERGCDLHSLRHTFASIGAHVQGGRYAGLVGALLGHGHQAKAITRRYITDDPEALRPAADAISGAIAGHLGLSEPAHVVEFPQVTEAKA